MKRMAKRFLSSQALFVSKTLKPGKISPMMTVPSHIQRPPSPSKAFVDLPSVELLSKDELTTMRQTCKLAAKALIYAGSLAQPGVTTDTIDKKTHEMIIENNAYPAPLGYGGFPKSICTAVNECLAHGIPDDRPLQSGDVVNIDVTVFKNGYHGDCALTVIVGSATEAVTEFVEIAKRCRDEAVNICGPGVPLTAIADVIDKIINSAGVSVSTALTGHGIGRFFHTYPLILHSNFCTLTDQGASNVMEPGMTFTIEPIICAGRAEHMTWDDGWTLVTKDGSLSAYFEHTIAITEDGHEILTTSE